MESSEESEDEEEEEERKAVKKENNNRLRDLERRLDIVGLEPEDAGQRDKEDAEAGIKDCD